MKKRIFAILISLLFVCCMPIVAFAAGGEHHVGTGDEFWNAWDAAIKDSGTVVLDRDVTIEWNGYVLKDSNNITIDLNGHSIKGVGSDAEYIFRVTDKAKLTITDNSKDASGYIQITNTSGKYKAVIAVDDDDAELVLKNGTLKGNGTKENPCSSRIVYVEDGKFTMEGGAVRDNFYAGWGSGVFIDEGSFVMTGGEICYNTANNQGDYNGCGGGVYYDGGSSTVFKMTGGEIHHNEAEVSGGGIYFDDGGKYTTFGSGQAILSGGRIHDNEAKYGGGIYMSDNSDGVELEGTLVITNNWSSEHQGGGVYVHRQDPWISDSTAIIGGSVQIYGNGANGATDVYCNPQYDAIEINPNIDTSPDSHAWVGVASSFRNFPMDRDQTYVDYEFSYESVDDKDYSVCFFGGEAYDSDTLSEYKKVQKLFVLSDKFVLTHNTREMDSVNLNYDALVDKDGNRVPGSGIGYTVEWDKTCRVITVDSKVGFLLNNDSMLLYSNSKQCKSISLEKREKTRDEDKNQTVYTLYYLCQFEKTDGSKTYNKNYYQTVVIKVDDHKVQFDMNGHGSTTIADQSVKDWEKASEPEEPAGDDGDIFRGWYTDSECTEKYDFDEPVTENIKLYAGWAKIGPPPLICRIDFDMNGHGTQVPTQGKGLGAEVEKPEDPSETGWTFGGWYKDQECTDEWKFGTDTVTGDTILYAKWEQDQPTPVGGPYTVSFIMNGHGSQIGVQTISSGEKAAEPNPAPSAEGWTFGGWYKNQECKDLWNFSEDTVTADTNLYAKWTAITYYVTFKGNFDGSGYSEVVSQTYGERYKLPNKNPTRERYSFVGWYTETQFGEKVTADTIVSKKSSHILYAQWKMVKKATCVPPTSIKGLEYTGEPQTVAYAGATKDGTLYYAITENETDTIDAEDWNTEVPKATYAKKYYVHYYVKGDEYHIDSTPAIIEVSIDAGTPTYTAPQPKNLTANGSMQELVTAGSTPVGTMYYAVSNSPEAPDKDSDDWKTEIPQAKDAGSYYVHYFVKVSEYNTNYVSTKPATVVVQMLPAKITVKFDMNGHGKQISNTTATAWSTIEAPSDPSEDNCTFMGWYREKECINQWNFGEDVVSENPTTLYAGWKVLIEYDVWVNGVKVTPDNADNVLEDANATVKYDAKSKTLILDNANLKDGYEDSDNDISCICIENSGVTSIVLKGNNSISSETANCGIKSLGNLKINGSGSLDITIDNDTENDVIALDCKGYLRNSSTLNVTAENSKGDVVAVSGADGLNNTGKITATSSDNDKGTMAVVCNVELKNSGEIVAKSGKAANSTSAAVVCDGDISNTGTITAEADKSANAFGILVQSKEDDPKAKLNNSGTITAASDGTDEHVGILVVGTVKNSGNITATTTNDGNKSYGILAFDDIDNSSTIYAIGKDYAIATFGNINNAPQLCTGGSLEHNASKSNLKAAQIGKIQLDDRDANCVMIESDAALTAYLGPHIDENKDNNCDICGKVIKTPDKDKDGDKSGNGSNTGDEHNVLPFVIAMVLALAAAGAVLTRRRKQ